MAQPEAPSDPLINSYLRQLSPQVRSRLLAELERLQQLGEEIPGSQDVIALLRGEFRGTAPAPNRVDAPSRCFFQPLEPVLVERAPERAHAGQISRSSLGPIWSWISEKLLRTMCAEYIEAVKHAIAINDTRGAEQIASAFQTKVSRYVQQMLATAEGTADIRQGLMLYTSSPATFDDLVKLMTVQRVREALTAFTSGLAPKISFAKDESVTKILAGLNKLRGASEEAVPFALTIIEKRLDTRWQIIELATKGTNTREAARLAQMPYALAVQLVLDQIEDKKQMLQYALRKDRMRLAKDLLAEIHTMESALKKRIDLRDSDWGRRLEELMAAVQHALANEVQRLPIDHQHLRHVLESTHLGSPHELMTKVAAVAERGRSVIAKLLPHG